MSDEEILRELLWGQHGHGEFLYGDDGEMQCGKCFLDFKRDPIARIYGRFHELMLERMMEWHKKQHPSFKAEISEEGGIIHWT